MIGPMKNFNIKVLGWFWLTLFVTILSIVIPAWIIQVVSEDKPLTPKKQRALLAATERIDRAYGRSNGELLILSKKLESLKRHIPYQWFLINGELEIVLQSSPLPPAFAHRLENRRFWYFMNSEQPREINLNWTSLVGPSPLASAPELNLVLWRPERPKPFDVLGALPWWAILGLFILVTTLMSWLLVRSIAQPLNRLGRAFDAVGSGDLGHAISIEHAKSPDRRFATSSQFMRLFSQFNTMTAKIAALIQNQKRQSADISHELRTPLTRLQMTLALIRKKSTDSEIQLLVQRAEKENELLNLHIERLSELTTMEARAIAQGRKAFCVEALLKELCADAQFEAEERKLAWQHSLVAARIAVFEEPFHIGIENVVRNAFKYARSQVSLRCKIDNKDLLIDIEDDGPGVSCEELDKLTQAFYRTDAARNSQTGGLGLGLAITAEAVRLNEGRLLFSLSEKGGLRVTFQFAIVND